MNEPLTNARDARSEFVEAQGQYMNIVSLHKVRFPRRSLASGASLSSPESPQLKWLMPKMSTSAIPSKRFVYLSAVRVCARCSCRSSLET